MKHNSAFDTICMVLIVLAWVMLGYALINLQIPTTNPIEPQDQMVDQRPAKCLKYLNKDPDNFDKEKHQLWAECMGVGYNK